MGYRSDVAISIYKKDFDLLCEEIKKETNKETFDAVTSLLKYGQIDVNEDNNPDQATVTMLFEEVKWYDGYKDVDFIMKFLHEDNREYSFKRVGEETGDIEEESNDEMWNLTSLTSVESVITQWTEGKCYTDKEKEQLFSDQDGEAIDSGLTFEDIGG